MPVQKQLKCKNMMHTQQISYLPVKSTKNLKEVIEKKLKPKKYAIIVHDKDIDKNGNPEEMHIHIQERSEAKCQYKNN